MATVLHITSGLGVGGSETMLVQLATHLQRRGHPQHVISLRGRHDLAPILEERGIPVVRLNIQSVRGRLAALVKIHAEIRRLSPAVIQSWMYHANLAAALAQLTVLRQPPRLYWGLRASNMDDARYRHLIEWNARLSRIPDIVIANSHAGAKFHIGRGFRCKRIEVVANGVDTEKFRPDLRARATFRAQLGFAPHEIVAIHVARVDPIKGHAVFLEAMKRLPQLKAVLVGVGTETLTLPQNVQALGVRRDIEDLYPGADIIVSSSGFGEGFSNAIAEAMSAGLMPVATDVGDASLIVEKTGSIVPPDDTAALTAALAQAVALPADVLRARGLRARNRVVEQFTIARAVENFEKLYFDT